MRVLLRELNLEPEAQKFSIQILESMCQEYPTSGVAHSNHSSKTTDTMKASSARMCMDFFAWGINYLYLLPWVHLIV